MTAVIKTHNMELILINPLFKKDNKLEYLYKVNHSHQASLLFDERKIN